MAEEGDWGREKCNLSLSNQPLEWPFGQMVVDNSICYFYYCVNMKTAYILRDGDSESPNLFYLILLSREASLPIKTQSIFICTEACSHETFL